MKENIQKSEKRVAKAVKMSYWPHMVAIGPQVESQLDNTSKTLKKSSFKSSLESTSQSPESKGKFQHKNSHISEIEEMKINLLSLFSHDLKTPLSKIIGTTDLLIARYSAKGDQEELNELKKIQTYSKILQRHIQRILQISQVEVQNRVLNKEPTDVNKLIKNALKQYRLPIFEKKISIVKNLQPLFMVDIDPVLIQEVIINFLENAINHSPEGETITIETMEGKKYLKVSVKDQGPGLEKANQKWVWEKQNRPSSPRSGQALGLFLSRYVIKLHKGRVFLNSQVGHGSQFGFMIPLEGVS